MSLLSVFQIKIKLSFFVSTPAIVNKLLFYGYCLYTLANNGIFAPNRPVQHRDDEYPEDGFAALWVMQERHFWYLGQHRLLLNALDRYRRHGSGPLAAVDLGGGGGWVR